MMVAAVQWRIEKLLCIEPDEELVNVSMVHPSDLLRSGIRLKPSLTCWKTPGSEPYGLIVHEAKPTRTSPSGAIPWNMIGLLNHSSWLRKYFLRLVAQCSTATNAYMLLLLQCHFSLLEPLWLRTYRSTCPIALQIDSGVVNRVRIVFHV